MVPQSHHFQNVSFQMFQYLNLYIFHLLHFKLLHWVCLTQICSLFLIRAFVHAVGYPDLSALLLSVCQLCCGSPFPHGVNIYWASMCETAFQAHQDSRWGCSPLPAGRLGGFEPELRCLKLESKNEIQANGERESTEGPRRLSTMAVQAKGLEVGMTGTLSDRDPKNYKNCSEQAGKGGLDKQPRNGRLPGRGFCPFQKEYWVQVPVRGSGWNGPCPPLCFILNSAIYVHKETCLHEPCLPLTTSSRAVP